MEPHPAASAPVLTPLTDDQRRMLRAQRWSAGAGTAAFGAVVVALAGAALIKLYSPGFASRGEWVLWGPLGLLWLWWLAPSVARLGRLQRDLRAGQAATITGRIHTDLSLGIGLVKTVKYTITVGPHRLGVDRLTFRALHSGDWYAVTYAPHARTLLAATPVVVPLPGATPSEARPAPVPLPGPEQLTAVEVELLRLIAAGRSNKEIAGALSLSVNTVKVYNSTLYAKLGVSRRTEAVARARELNLL